MSLSQESVRHLLRGQRFGDRAFCEFGEGIGVIIDVEPSSGHKIIRRIIPDSPADRNGILRLGDQITEINGKEIWVMDVKKVRNVLQNNDKSVTITVARKVFENGPMSPSGSSSEGAHSFTFPSSQMGTRAVSSPPATVKPNAISTESPSTSTDPNSDSDVSVSSFLEIRCRSDSDMSDAMTAEEVTVDGKVVLTVLLEKGKVEDNHEQFLECVSYCKGHLSFIKGNLFKRIPYNKRWVAVRNGKLIVTKGKRAKITKILNIPTSEITSVLQSDSGSSPEYFVGVKAQGISTLYFGHKIRSVVEKLRSLLVDSVDTSILETPPTTAPGFCASKVSCPEDMASEYFPMK